LPFDFCDLPFDLFFGEGKAGQKAKGKNDTGRVPTTPTRAAWRHGGAF
jgi:hypothetical protein